MANEPADWLWEQRSRWYLEGLVERDFRRFDPDAFDWLDLRDDQIGGPLQFRTPITAESAARMLAGSELLARPVPEIVERALATQWHLDKRLSGGAELVVRG